LKKKRETALDYYRQVVNMENGAAPSLSHRNALTKLAKKGILSLVTETIMKSPLDRAHHPRLYPTAGLHAGSPESFPFLFPNVAATIF